jgi:hypothetical protein
MTSQPDLNNIYVGLKKLNVYGLAVRVIDDTLGLNIIRQYYRIVFHNVPLCRIKTGVISKTISFY